MSFLAVLAGLLALRRDELSTPRRVAKAKGQVREGLAYVRERPDLLVVVVLVAMIGTFGLNFQITMALVAKEVFGQGAGSFGLLTSMLAVGSLIGALASARRTGRPARGGCCCQRSPSGCSRCSSGSRPATRSCACCSSRPASPS